MDAANSNFNITWYTALYISISFSGTEKPRSKAAADMALMMEYNCDGDVI